MIIMGKSIRQKGLRLYEIHKSNGNDLNMPVIQLVIIQFDQIKTIG